MCTAEKPFIIVIDVDNNRAFKAYSKGMNDLMDIWPQLMEAGEKADEKREIALNAARSEQEAHRQERHKRNEEFFRKLEAYNQALESWNKSNTLFRGERPKDPRWEHPLYFPELDFPPSVRIPHGRGVAVYKSIRDELQKMLNLAGAATGPYRMMEGQVHVMIEWESGHRIQELLDYIKEQK